MIFLQFDITKDRIKYVKTISGKKRRKRGEGKKRARMFLVHID